MGKRTMKYSIVICLFLFLIIASGCSQTKEITEIKPRVIKPEIMKDTLDAFHVVEHTSVSDSDSVVVGVSVIKNDTVTIIKYYPKREKFTYQAKPDSIVLWDTIKVTKTEIKKEEMSFLSKAGLVLIGIIVGIIGFFFFKR